MYYIPFNSLSKNLGLIYGVKINDQDTVSYTYDELARIKERTLNLTSPFKTSFGYAQGPSSGTTTAMVERIQNGNDILSYTYDNIGNIETISENGELKATYHYDELNQLIREDNLYLNKSISYSYDTGGNILSVSEYAYTTGELGEVVAVKTYGYEDANWKDKLTSYNGQTITYDEIGNPTYYYNGLSLDWENGRQLSSGETGAAGGSFSYDYNDAGLRVQKSAGGYGVTDYYYNGDQLLSQVNGNIQMDFLYDDAESLIGFLYNGTAYYYVRNLQNDIIGILDSDGNQVVSYVYDSWGKLISTSGSLADTIGFQNPFRYRGYYYDQETGFYYLQSRYYDPETGRFLNADDSDILTEDQNDLLEHNLFAYCFNNPVNMADPSGHVAISAVIGGVLGGVTGAALGVILANMLNLKGIARGLFIAGVAVAGAALGAFLGPYVAKLMPKLLQYTKVAAKKAVKAVKNVKNIVKTATNIRSTVSRALSRLNKNNIHHILQSKHLWRKVCSGTWSSVSRVIDYVVRNGTFYDKGNLRFYYMNYGGSIVEVKTIIVNGALTISDAWVRSRR